MEHVNITEFRARLRDYLSHANSGQTISILSRGKEIARLLPPEPKAKDAKKTLARWRKTCRIGDVVSPIDTEWSALHDPA